MLTAAAVQHPSVTAVRPGNTAHNVPLDDFIAADVMLPNPGAGIDPATLTSSTVTLTRASDGKQVAATLNTSGGGDAIVLQPLALLDANTKYTFTVTSGLLDATGASFVPFTSTFTTGTTKTNADPTIIFDKVGLSNATGQSFSAVTIGPDHKLYAAALSGQIFRYAINSDGTLGTAQVIRTINNVAGEKRFITGITFDPKSTKDNLILWVSHTQYAFDDGDDWTGKLTKIYGANLEGYQDYVIGLPRSIRDHVTNQSAFGPDGKLYLMQAANTAMGGPDNAWGMRQEHLLNAAVLQIDLNSIAQRRKDGLGPLNVKTEGAGAYDPNAKNAPLKLYATGIRNGYDLIWADNGHLYVASNGSAAGGTTPTGGGVTGSSNVAFTEPDYLYDVVQGGYYGHPNPARGEWVMDGGNPTSGVDKDEVPTYPVGTQPDSNYRGSAWNFGTNYSPDGIIQYHGNAFDGKLDGKLLICQYSGGDNLISLSLDSKGKVSGDMQGMTGTTHFVDPLDLVEDNDSGNVYVVEHGAGKITLLRPQALSSPGGNPQIATNTTRRIYNDVRGGAASPARIIKIYNKGSSTLQVTDLSFSGPDAGMFVITDSNLTIPRNIKAGKSISIHVAFAGSPKKSLGIKTAQLNISSNDPTKPVAVVRLRGLSTAGEGGLLEPSLQQILDLYQIPDKVGDSDSSTTILDTPPKTPNDEVTIQRLVKAGAGTVSIEPLGVFANATNPALIFGYYEAGSPQNQTDLFRVDKGSAQSVNPFFNGSTIFDPGDGSFGLYSVWPTFTNKTTDGFTRTVYSEDSLNTWESITANRRKVRFYPLKNSDGSVVPNAYVFAFEEFTQDYDQQDVVGIIRNVKAAPSGPEMGLENTDNAPFNDRLVMSRIKNLNQTTPNVVHDIARVRVRNTGTSTLNVTSMTITGTFAINSGNAPFSVAPGSFKDVTIRFTAGSGDTHVGTLTLNSNDTDRPSRQVQLAGFWQSDSEENAQHVSQEPTLQEITSLFGYSTTILDTGQSLDENGKVHAVGEEVLSPFWAPADPDLAVKVVQLVAYHQMPNTATFSWYAKGSSTNNKVFTSLGPDAQTVLPRMSTSGTLAAGQFKPGGTFGIKVDSENSDDTKNKQEQSGAFGHHLRFYPVRDRNGKYLANTYLLGMDYNSINFDYQDNVYLISNIRPEKQLPAPQGANAYTTNTGVHIDWSDPASTSNLQGYYIWRAISKTAKYTLLNSTPITDSFFDDATTLNGRTLYYRIVAVDNSNVQSSITTTSTFRNA
jgi:glucose/arabinose dehydrogenase